MAISLALGVIFAVLYYKAQQNLFQGGKAQVTEGPCTEHRLC